MRYFERCALEPIQICVKRMHMERNKKKELIDNLFIFSDMFNM